MIYGDRNVVAEDVPLVDGLRLRRIWWTDGVQEALIVDDEGWVRDPARVGARLVNEDTGQEVPVVNARFLLPCTERYALQIGGRRLLSLRPSRVHVVKIAE